MRRFSSAFIVIMGAIIMLLPAVSTQANEGIEVGFGSMRIGGNYQGYFAWYEDDDTASEFDTKRARLLVFGKLIPDKLDYFIQASGLTKPYLLDSKLIFTGLSNTTICVGRFIPNYSLYMPKSTAKLNLINYPLTTSKTAMWRQTGIQSTTKFSNVDLTVGIYNGFQTNDDSDPEKISGNDWGDNNDAKDFLLRADIKPLKGLKLGLFGWFGSAYNESLDDDFDVSRYGVNIEWTGEQVYLAGEYILANTDTAVPGGKDFDSEGFFAHLGYFFNEYWEVHARFDSWDPNSDTDDDSESWITAGINYKMHKYNSMFYLNYIARDEEDDDIDNDEIVLMFQYSF